jgi:DNA-binding helix-hairpin-helix protein with protein kinase domain
MSSTKPMTATLARCKPHSAVAAATETMGDHLRCDDRAAAGRALAMALTAAPLDAADALLKAMLELQFLRPLCPERHRPVIDTWIAEIGAVGARLKPTAPRMPATMASLVEEYGDKVERALAFGD